MTDALIFIVFDCLMSRDFLCVATMFEVYFLFKLNFHPFFWNLLQNYNFSFVFFKIIQFKRFIEKLKISCTHCLNHYNQNLKI